VTMQSLHRWPVPQRRCQATTIDTDLIIRIERLAHGPREELDATPSRLCAISPDGGEPAFPFNQPMFASPDPDRRRQFRLRLVARGRGLGLMGLGLRLRIAPSFGDIFYNNCFQTGVLPIALDADKLRLLRRARPTAPADGRPRGAEGLMAGRSLGALRDRRAQTRIPARRVSMRSASTLRDADLNRRLAAADRANEAWLWELAASPARRIDLLAGAGEAA